MVTNYGGTGDLMCSSTDVKPTDVAVNTRCLELDTGKFWYFNGTSWTETPGGGGGGSATLIEKSVTTNGTYTASDDDADGYSSVEVDVPNTYTVDDNGKVVSNQTLVAQTAKPDTITVNDTYNTTEYNSVTVNVPNSYTVADEGKVVSGGALVSQTAYPSTIVVNGTYDTTLNNSVTVDVPPPGDDVLFIDYDGTIVYSYSKADFLALTEMPANPTHSGLTAQGWNWTLADAKTQVTLSGKCEIGQNYITSDGRTRIYVELTDYTLSPYLCLTNVVNGGTVTIYWGDGTNTVKNIGDGLRSVTHTYSTAGKYVIELQIDGDGVLAFGYGMYSSRSPLMMATAPSTSAPSVATKSSLYQNTVYKIEVGNHIRGIHGGAREFTGLSRMYSLQTISIPTTFTEISAHSFSYCCNLKCVVLPSGITTIDDSCFRSNHCIEHVCIPKSITSIGSNAFTDTSTPICLPVGITTIASQANCNVANSELPSTITSLADSSVLCTTTTVNVNSGVIPSGITTVPGAFLSYSNIRELTIPSTMSIAGNYVCRNAYWLERISVDADLYPYTNFCDGCTALKEITLGNNVVQLAQNTFNGCYSLTSITIPNNVTSILSTAFATCYSLGEIIINKTEGSISGAPWGAPNATVVWTG